MKVKYEGIRGEKYLPISWTSFFDSKETVKAGDGNEFNVYRKGETGPVFFLLHGGGYSGLTWSCFVEELTKEVECQVIAPDLRGHGQTKTSDDDDLSLETQIQDIKNIYFGIFSRPDNFPHCIMVGHSMGGALAVNVCERELIPNMFSLAVIDVVEGTAVAALQQMRHFLTAIRPPSFPDMDHAINWAVKSGTCRWIRQACVSMPSQLKHVGQQLEWRINLMKSEPYWAGWFEGLSKKFLNCKPTKILILAHVDRLDKDLTVAQMQGKFQQVVMANSGHAVHEDCPREVAALFTGLLKRYKVILEKNKANNEKVAPINFDKITNPHWAVPEYPDVEAGSVEPKQSSSST